MNRESISHSINPHTAFEGIAIFGMAGETISVNARMEQILGCTAEEVASLECMADMFSTSNSGDLPPGMERLRACSESGTYVRISNHRNGDRWCRIALSKGENDSLILHCLDCTSDKLREDSLRESERRFRSLFEESRDAISFNGAQECLVNQAWLDLFGFSPEDMKNFDPICVYTNPEDRKRFIRELETKGFVKDFEVKLRKKDGTEIDCLYTTTVFREENGVHYYRGIVRDITNLNRMFAAQRESEEKFRTLFEESKDAISFYGPREFTVNQAWLDFFGYTREELTGLDILSLYANPGDRTIFIRELETTGFVRDFEIRLVRKNGEVIDCVSTARAQRTGNGGVKYFQSILRDITPMKRMLEALRESEEKYRHLVENIQEVIYSVDTEGVITYISPIIETLSGYSAGDLIGKSLANVHYVHPADLPMVEEAFRDAIPGKPNYHEFRFLTRYGEILWFRASVYAVMHDGELIGRQGILVDITKSIQAKQELLESEERLRSFLDSATDGFLLFDPYLNLVKINCAAQNEFSLREEDIHGTSLSSFLKTIRFPHDPQIFTQILTTGEPFEIKNISFGECSVDFKVFRVGYGLGIITTNTTEQKRAEKALQQTHAELENRVAERTLDLRKANEDLERQINERRRAQETLARRERELNALLNNLPDMAWFKDTESRFILVNEATARRSGIRAEQMKGMTDYDFWRREEAERFVQDDRRVLETGEMLRVEEPLTDRSGEKIVIETIKSPIRDESGNNIGTVGIARDITERMKTENILRENEERYRTLFENAGIALIEIDIERFRETVEQLASQGITDFADFFSTHYKRCRELYLQIRMDNINNKAVEIFDVSSREQLLAISRDYYNDDRIPLMAELARTITQNKLDMAVEFEGVTPGGKKKYVQINIAIPPNPERRNRILVSITDLTERKHFEDALRAARDTLEERVRERTEVLASTNRELEREITERETAERALQYYSGFQERISSISTDFINLPAGEIDRGVNHALQIVGEFTGGERGFLYRFSENLREAVLTHEWCLEGIPSRFVDQPRFSLDENDITLSRLKQFEIVHIPSIPLFQDATENEMKKFEACNIMSVIIVPLIRNGVLIGSFGFDSLNKEHTWDRESVSLLKLMGEILVNALERNSAERRILDYQEKLRSIASELILTEERERRRIAVELHDRIGQPLAVSRIKLGVLKGQCPKAESVKIIDEVNAFINEAMGDTRSLIFEISPPILYDLGLEPALEWLVENLQKQHGIAAEFRDDRQEKPLEHDLKILLFQSVRELLTNIVKHAAAHQVIVTVRRKESMVEIAVRDDGIGFDAGIIEMRSARNIGFGLFSIRERLEHLGGGLTVESRPGIGSLITITAPINREI